MSLNPSQRQVWEEWMRSKAIVVCPGRTRGAWPRRPTSGRSWRREPTTSSKPRGVVKVACDNCGLLTLFDAETIGIRGLWAEGRDL